MCLGQVREGSVVVREGQWRVCGGVAGLCIATHQLVRIELRFNACRWRDALDGQNVPLMRCRHIQQVTRCPGSGAQAHCHINPIGPGGGGEGLWLSMPPGITHWARMPSSHQSCTCADCSPAISRTSMVADAIEGRPQSTARSSERRCNPNGSNIKLRYETADLRLRLAIYMWCKKV